MRLALLFALSVGALPDQFRTTAPLVVVPATVTDARGRPVDGLTARDLILYDNSVPQPVQVDTSINPISLVVLIQSNLYAEAVLDKLHGIGSLLTDLLSGHAGETALVTYSDTVSILQDFTDDSTRLSSALRNLRFRGYDAALRDGIAESLRLLAARGSGRRPVLLVIGERRDRSSKMPLEALLARRELQSTVIYWLTYSSLLAPFTNKPKTVWDRMTDEQKNRPERMQGKLKFPHPEETRALPPDVLPGNLLTIFKELAHQSAPDLAAVLPVTTGGRTFTFLKQSGLESAIQAVAEEVHQQYVLSFRPPSGRPGLFHTLRAEVKGRPELQVRTRSGYWAVD